MNQEHDYANDRRALSILAQAMITGVVLFAGVSIATFYLGDKTLPLAVYGDTVFGVLVLAGAILVLVLRSVYSKRFNALKEEGGTAQEKLARFRSLTIVHLAVCEFIALAGIICFMLMGNFLFFLVVLMALAEMGMKFPTRERMHSVVNSASY